MKRGQAVCYWLSIQDVGWVDIFTRQVYSDIVVDSLRYCQDNKGLVVHSWVIMSNHVHCIISSKTNKLSDTIRDFKRHTSKHILEQVENIGTESRKKWMLHQFKYYASQHKRNVSYQLWTHENHPIELNGVLYDQKLDYIHNNPVKAGLVENAENYLSSSARDYAGVKGLLGVSFL